MYRLSCPPWAQKVVGSNPAAPIKLEAHFSEVSFLRFGGCGAGLWGFWGVVATVGLGECGSGCDWDRGGGKGRLDGEQENGRWVDCEAGMRRRAQRRENMGNCQETVNVGRQEWDRNRLPGPASLPTWRQ